MEEKSLYDSTADTLLHIKRVNKLLTEDKLTTLAADIVDRLHDLALDYNFVHYGLPTNDKDFYIVMRDMVVDMIVERFNGGEQIHESQ
jgi:hypothetical protein